MARQDGPVVGYSPMKRSFTSSGTLFRIERMDPPVVGYIPMDDSFTASLTDRQKPEVHLVVMPCFRYCHQNQSSIQRDAKAIEKETVAKRKNVTQKLIFQSVVAGWYSPSVVSDHERKCRPGPG